MQQIKGGASLLWMQFRKKAEENTKVYVNTETWRGLADGPCLNCGSTPLCNTGKQTRGFQKKQENDCFEVMSQRGSWLK